MQMTLRLENKAKGRYYKVELQRDLLGDWTVCSIWGGLQSRLGNHQMAGHHSLEDAIKHVLEVTTRKYKDGYS